MRPSNGTGVGMLPSPPPAQSLAQQPFRRPLRRSTAQEEVPFLIRELQSPCEQNRMHKLHLVGLPVWTQKEAVRDSIRRQGDGLQELAVFGALDSSV